MELTINRRELSRALEPLTKISDRKTTMAVLEHFRLVASDGVVGVSATNTIQSGTSHAPAAIAKRGDVLVPAAGFAGAVAKMPDGDLTLATEKGSLELRAGRTRVRLPTMASTDFPVVPLTESGTWISLPGPAVREALAAGWAAGIDSARPMFCTLLFELDATRLRGVAVDGYVLAQHDVRVERSADQGNLRCVIPSPAIPLLQRVVGNAERVDVLLGRLFEVRVGPVHFATVPADDHFPPFEGFIPKEVATRVRVQRADLLDAIERASLALDAKNPALEIAVKAGVLTVASEAERGTAADAMDVDQDGPDVTFYVAPNRLLGATKNHVADEVQINVATPLLPIVITDPNDGARLTLACPMDVKR